jgi:hypothetical protein
MSITARKAVVGIFISPKESKDHYHEVVEAFQPSRVQCLQRQKFQSERLCQSLPSADRMVCGSAVSGASCPDAGAESVAVEAVGLVEVVMS